NQILSHFHCQRQGLQNEMIAISVDDHTGNTVTFAPYNATQFWIDMSPVAIVGSLRDAAPEEIKIKILPPPREAARDNLRFGIVNGAADQAILTVLERDHIAVRGISKNLQDFTGKHPIVSVQHPRARFHNDSGHRNNSTSNVQRLTSNTQQM